MASGERGGANLASSAWAAASKVTEVHNDFLTVPFIINELEVALSSTRTNTAPRPDGFPVTFYKKFWPLVGRQMFELLGDFTKGRLDIKRLNYVIISFFPKILGADLIKQFRHIA